MLPDISVVLRYIPIHILGDSLIGLWNLTHGIIEFMCQGTKHKTALGLLYDLAVGLNHVNHYVRTGTFR